VSRAGSRESIDWIAWWRLRQRGRERAEVAVDGVGDGLGAALEGDLERLHAAIDRVIQDWRRPSSEPIWSSELSKLESLVSSEASRL